MSKNIRRGRTGSVVCGSCGQLTRRDRSVYLFRGGIKIYYCPDCAKKIRGSRLYKGMPKYVRHVSPPKTRKKFIVYSKENESESAPTETVSTSETPENPGAPEKTDESATVNTEEQKQNEV